jgi:hypothetical protein
MLEVRPLKYIGCKVRDEEFWPIRTLMKVTDSISEIPFAMNPLKRLLAREKFIELCRCLKLQDA